QEMLISYTVGGAQGRFIRMKSASKKRTPTIENLTVKRRYLTEREVERLMDCARKYGRYGHRDATMILVAYRHGPRASEVCDLQWQQIELSEGRLHVHRVKNGIPSVQPIRGDEMRALRKLRRDYPTDAHVFVSERGGPISPIGFHRLIQRLGEAAKMPFPIHPHMLAMPVGSSSRTMATTRGPCSTTLGTRTSSTPSEIPKWRQTDSRIFGGTDDGGAGSIAPHGRSSRWKKTTRHIVEITRPLAVASCAECAPAARSQCRPRSSAGSACAWTIAFRGTALREPGARQVLASSQPGARSQPLEPPSFREETQSHSLALRPSWF